MTGRELIEWIIANKAEDMPVVIQYRDDGGECVGGEFISSPTLANVRGNGVPYDQRLDISYNGAFHSNAIVL